MAAATKKKSKKTVQAGVAYIQASFNNTIITICDTEGNTLVQGSPRVVGFSGSKRSTAFAATKAAIDAAQKAIKKYGLREVKVYLAGPGSGRNAAVKGLDSAGLNITLLADRTPLPHNGCRPRKAPRN
ncbi:30S ribosomal protein S11 [Candidatus Dojkabacteria bacterium]|uniref:Small ribosomal subunit protein uS11 n=1 Tax=Candidatus Dojkabacteria bacterium TaxID=2099670 RepID=A0A955KVN6_9BACT|nr:30S ribosomal protein S11 [Candidatus Dojkabacteria bacterium]MCB9790785.1 30S ribosomal protein S11 [Candidatus Nomurabacteria bacterium]